MIHRDDVIPMLLAVCPSFAPIWQRLERDRSIVDEGSGTRLYYVEVGEFAVHLVDLMRRRQGEEIRRSFDVIESLHVRGDAYIQELATIGLLEGVQNHARNSSDVTPDDFLPYLGAETRRWWRGIDAFWSGDASAVQAVED